MMKNLLLITSTLLIICSSCKTQGVLSKKEITSQGITYINNGKASAYTGNIIVKNKNNVLEGTDAFPDKPKEWLLDGNGLIVDNAKLKTLIADQFALKRLKELESEKSFAAFIYLDEYGKVLEISFAIQAGSNISAKELANIEHSLQSNFTVTFRDRRTFEGIRYFSITLTAYFDELIKIKEQK